MLTYLGFMLKFLGLVFFWYKCSQVLFSMHSKKNFTICLITIAGFEHGWFFCEVLRSSFIAEILSVETQGF